MRRIDLNELKARAQGRWPEILQALGLPAALLNPHKHQPCPACGGIDRFRWTNHKGGGGFICNHCTPEGGSGFDLAMLVLGYSFREAVRAVAAVLGMAGTVPTPANTLPPQPPAPAKPSNEQGERLAALWAECRPWLDSRQIADYLHARGIPLPEKLPVSDDLRFHAGLPYWHGAEKRPLGRLAAMAGLFRAVDGTPAGLHITYLVRNRAGQVGKAVLSDPKTGQRLPAKKMRSTHSGSLSGAAIRLFAPENGTLAVCEGIETALAARYLCGLPVWACGSAHGISSLVLPDAVRELVIISDNDANGRQAARALQRRYHARLHGRIKIWEPDLIGCDALDVLAAMRQKGSTP